MSCQPQANCWLGRFSSCLSHNVNCSCLSNTHTQSSLQLVGSPQSGLSNQSCLSNFDLTEYRHLLSDRAVSIYREIVQLITTKIQPLAGESPPAHPPFTHHTHTRTPTLHSHAHTPFTHAHCPKWALFTHLPRLYFWFALTIEDRKSSKKRKKMRALERGYSLNLNRITAYMHIQQE